MASLAGKGAAVEGNWHDIRASNMCNTAYVMGVHDSACVTGAPDSS